MSPTFDVMRAQSATHTVAVPILLGYTVKEVRGKVSFDLQNDKYASQLSCDASP
jgi:hypothetical protein